MCVYTTTHSGCQKIIHRSLGSWFFLSTRKVIEKEKWTREQTTKTMKAFVFGKT